MPYVKDDLRSTIELELRALIGKINHAYTVSGGDAIPKEDYNGVLNYCVTELLVSCIKHKYKRTRYNGINDIVGVLECAKLEMYRRLGGPYEDVCITNNGDVRAYE